MAIEPIGPIRPISLGGSSTGHRRGARAARDPELRETTDLLAALLGVDVARASSALEDAGGLLELSRMHAAEIAVLSGVGRYQATGAVTAFELGRRAAASGVAPGWQVRSPADVGERLVPAMRHLLREELRVLLLNTKNVVVGGGTLYSGNLAGSSVRVGEVFRDAVRRQAAAIVVAHNHPSGDPTPSTDDLRITADMIEAGRLLDVELLDHVVVGAGSWVSIRSLGAWT
jgi:DNA repair protein RadC